MPTPRHSTYSRKARARPRPIEVSGGKPINVGKGTWVPGRQYYALATDSASENDKSYIYVVDDASVRPKTAITVEAWVKLKYTSGYLVCKNGSFFLTLGDGVFSAEFITDGTSCTASGVRSVPVGQWVHLAATWQRVQTGTTYTGTASIYINGVLDAQAQLTGLATGLMTIPSYGPKFVIGNNDWSTTGAEMDGKVDSLRISNIARVFTPLPPATSEAPSPPGNLVPNGDFEIGLNGWCPDDYGDVNLDWETTGGAAHGQKCLHSLSGANPAAGVYSRPIPAHPGRPYTFSGWFKTSAKQLQSAFRGLGLWQRGGDGDGLPGTMAHGEHFLEAVDIFVHASRQLCFAFLVRPHRLSVLHDRRRDSLRGRRASDCRRRDEHLVAAGQDLGRPADCPAHRQSVPMRGTPSPMTLTISNTAPPTTPSSCSRRSPTGRIIGFRG